MIMYACRRCQFQETLKYISTATGCIAMNFSTDTYSSQRTRSNNVGHPLALPFFCSTGKAEFSLILSHISVCVL